MSSKLKSFNLLIHDYWETYLSTFPLIATLLGYHKNNNKVEGFSNTDFKNRIAFLRGIQSSLQKIDSTEFSHEDKLNYDIFKRILNREIKFLEFKAYRMSISKIMNFTAYQFNPSSYTRAPFNTVEDYKNYIERLHCFSRIVDENIEILESGIDDGQVQPKIVMKGVAKAFRDYLLTNPESSSYFNPFMKLSLPDTIDKDQKDKIVKLGKKVISECVFPALRQFTDFLENNYIPACREDISATSLPNGKEYYDFCIEYHTSLDPEEWNPQKIHDIGLKEVARIRKEMKKILIDVDFKGSIKEFVKFLRTNTQFYAQTSEILLEKTALVLKRMDGQLPRLFKKLPRIPYGIQAVPDNIAPGTTTAYYQPGTGDGTQAGNYFVNTYNLKNRPLYEIEALSFHEAVPGHHLQLTLQQELDLPMFRRYKSFTSFVEGWALYAERLGLEVGFYKDPYSNFGRLSYEMWRSCRLVVDTGIHALKWSRQQAIEFMAENTSLSLLNIENEVDRYIAWPGQALAYKLGEIKISNLRKKAEQALSKSFNIREFHDLLLKNGSLPLDLLDNVINEFINLKMSKNSKNNK